MERRKLTAEEYYSEFKKKPNKITISDLEREIILTLTLHTGNINKIARELGKSFITIADELSKLKKYRTKQFYQTYKTYKNQERKRYVEKKLKRLSKVYEKPICLTNLEKEIIIALALDSKYQINENDNIKPDTFKIAREIDRNEHTVKRILKDKGYY